MSWPRVRLAEVFCRSNETILLDPEVEYREVTVKLWGKGVTLRGRVSGAGIAGVRRFVAHSGQFILSRIDARNGAIGIIPPELEGAVVTNDFPLFAPNPHKVEAAFLGWLGRTKDFVELCQRASEGTTNRVRLQENQFLALEIPIPSLAEQQTIVACLDSLANKVQQVYANLDAIEAEAEQLLAVQFQKAVDGAPCRPIGDVAPLVRRKILIDPNVSYTELGVRSFFKGTFQRRTVTGSEFTWQEIYQVQKGDLIFSNIMSWEQAIALAKDQDDGCVGNHRMLTCEVDGNLAIPEFLWYYFTTPEGFAKIYAASPGTVARNRTMTSAALMGIEVPIPSLENQRTFAQLHSQLVELKAHHASIRNASQAIIPATLERLFSKA